MKKLAVLLAVPLLLGCSKKNPTTVVQSKAIFAEINTNSAEVHIVSEPTMEASGVTARVIYENVQVTLLEKEAKPGMIYLRDYFPNPLYGFRCSLEVSTPLGSSRGVVRVPWITSLYRPRDGDTLPWADILVAWSYARGDWYELDYGYSAGDSNRNWLGSADTQTVTTDTSAVIRLSFLQKYPGATYLYLYCWVYPHQGPKPGEAGNMSGDIRGYLLGSGWGDGAGFCMGSPPPGLGSVLPPRMDEEKRRVALRRLYGL